MYGNGNAWKSRKGGEGGVCVSAFCVSVREPAFPSTSLRFYRQAYVLRVYVSLTSLSLSTSLRSACEPSFLPTSMFFCQRVCLSVNVSAFLATGLPFWQRVCLSVNGSAFLPTGLPFCQRVCLSVNGSAFLPTSLLFYQRTCSSANESVFLLTSLPFCQQACVTPTSLPFYQRAYLRARLPVKEKKSI
jgi:hypothetical protein